MLWILILSYLASAVAMFYCIKKAKPHASWMNCIEDIGISLAWPVILLMLMSGLVMVALWYSIACICNTGINGTEELENYDE